MRIIDLSINKRLWLAILLPLMAALALALLEIWNSWTSLSQMQTIVRVSKNMETIGEIVHALQAERGQSAGFIGAKGAMDPAPLLKARQAADEALVRLPDLAAAFADLKDVELVERVANVQSRAEALSSLRQSIDALSASGKQSFETYTGLIAELTALASELSLKGAGSRIAAEMVAHSLLMQAKEVAGQERGTGNGIISSGRIDPAAVAPFAQMAGAQDALIKSFISLQPRDLQLQYLTTLDVPAVKEVEAVRAKLVGADAASGLAALDAKSWFAASTQRIDAMKEIESASLQRLARQAGDTASDALQRLGMLTAICVLGAGLVVMLSTYLARTISQPLRLLVQSMRKLAQGDLEAQDQGSDRKDEVGDMARAVEVFRLAAIRNLELEREAELARENAEREREELRRTAEAQAEARLNEATGTLALALRKLAAGDLVCEVDQPFAPQFEALRQDFNSSIIQLRQALASVGRSVATVTGGASEVSSASDDLSRRTEQQAASLEETAAALEQITANVTATSKRSELARHVTGNARQKARRSSEVVRNAIAAMDRIEQASHQIGQIIGVIDQIAFQTNLLALNAGVEAARAGDAGKGFAVVAQEVRELAQRSAQAAREISALIGHSELAVKQGVELVSETGSGLTEIDDLVQEAALHVDAIATAAQEQAAGLSQVNVAVNHLDQTTQQNAAMVEEMSAAGAALAGESLTLQNLLATFRLASGDRSAGQGRLGMPSPNHAMRAA